TQLPGFCLLTPGNCQRLAKLGLGGNLSVRDSLSQEQVAIELTKPSLKKAFFRLIHDPQRFFYRLKAFIRLIVDPIGFRQKREPPWLPHPCSVYKKTCHPVPQLNTPPPRSPPRSRAPARHNACLRLPKRKTVLERQCLHLIGQFFDDLRFSSALVDEK